MAARKSQKLPEPDSVPPLHANEGQQDAAGDAKVENLTVDSSNKENSTTEAPDTKKKDDALQSVQRLAAFVPPKPKVVAKPNKMLGALRKACGDAITQPTRGVLVSTGVIGVDMCLAGGLNFGSAHEFFGFSKSGKTYLMQRTVACAQALLPDCIAVFFDRENAYDPQVLAGVGIDLDRTIIVPAKEIPTPTVLWDVCVNIMEKIDTLYSSEEADAVQAEKQRMKELRAAAKTDPTMAAQLDAEKKATKEFFGRRITKRSPHVIMCIDSIPAFAEKEDMVEDQGRRAKGWHAFLRRFTGMLEAKLMLLMSNHIIYKPGAYGNPEAKTSGTAIDYYRDCGIKCMSLHSIYDKNDVVIGNVLGVEVDKSRRGAQGGHCFFPVYYSGGASYYSGLLSYMEYLGIAKQANPSTFKDKKAYGRVWPTYTVEVSGGSIKLSEEDPEKLRDAIEKYGLIQKVQDFVDKHLSMVASGGQE